MSTIYYFLQNILQVLRKRGFDRRWICFVKILEAGFIWILQNYSEQQYTKLKSETEPKGDPNSLKKYPESSVSAKEASKPELWIPSVGCWLTDDRTVDHLSPNLHSLDPALTHSEPQVTSSPSLWKLHLLSLWRLLTLLRVIRKCLVSERKPYFRTHTCLKS